MLAHLMDVSLRSMVIAAIAAAVLWRQKGAALRHAVWAAVVCGMLALFLFGRALPRLPVLELPGKAERAPLPVQQPVRITIARDFAGEAEVSMGQASAGPLRPARRAIDWSEMALGTYASIAFLFFARFLLGMFLAWKLVVTSRPLGRFRESDSITVPLTIGWLQPQMLLPSNWRQWDRTKLDAVLAHEAAHARRRDGLVAGLAGINRCIFWFHPLAWWLERRLTLLAELACDEVCLAELGDRQGYANLLLEMARAVGGSQGRLRAHAIPMAASSHLRQRIDSVLKDGPEPSRGLKRTAWAAIALCAVPVVLGAGTIALVGPTPLPPLLMFQRPPYAPAPPPPPQRSEARLKFEVASIRLAGPSQGHPAEAAGGVRGNAPPPPPPPGGGGCIPRTSVNEGRVDRLCASLRELLWDVFDVAPTMILGPDWMDDARFDISAKLPAGASTHEIPAMIQSLLEERFGLTYHRAVREGPVNALVVAKGGLKLQPAAPESAQPAWVAEAASVPGPYGAGYIGGIRFRSFGLPNVDGTTTIWQSPAFGFVRRTSTDAGAITHYEAPSITPDGLAALARLAAPGMDPAVGVVDMTGLKGRYQVNLDVSITDLLAEIAAGRRDPAFMQSAWLNAAQDGLKKLGLELQPRKAPVEVIVVDHLEKNPTAN